MLSVTVTTGVISHLIIDQCVSSLPIFFAIRSSEQLSQKPAENPNSNTIFLVASL